MRSRCLNVSRKWRHTIFNILLMSFICLSVHGTAHASSAGSPLNVDGSNAQTQGSYNLTSGTISYPAENIGINYSAYMVQGANTTNNIYGDLGIGLNSGSTGYYTLNGGNLNISGNIVGGLGTSNFNIDGGSLNGISGNNFAGNITVTGLTIGVSGTGSFTQAAPTVVSANYYNVGYNSGSQGSYALNSGQLSATTGKIGVNGTGTFNQTGGIQTTTNINVGMNAGSQGTYTLSGNSVLNTQNMVIGSSGTGNFTQSGGGFNTTAFNLGLNEGSVGTYTQTGGILSNFDANGVSGYEVIGVNGVGTYNQSGGSNISTGSRDFILGRNANSDGTASQGTYNLSGTGILSVSGNEILGRSGGNGIFNQSGGSNTTSTLNLGRDAGSTGTYALSQGSLSTTTTRVGDNGQGTFTQTGGTHTATTLTIGSGSGSNGSYRLSQGSLSTGTTTVGGSGQGTFTQTGGNSSASNSLQVGSQGTLNLSGGTMTAGAMSIVQGGAFNYSGGSLSIGSGGSLGTMTNSGVVSLFGGSSLTIAGNVTNNGSFTVNGSGGTSVTVTGTFINNGSFVSDPALNIFNNLIIGNNSTMSGGTGDIFEILGSLTYDSTSTNGLELGNSELVLGADAILDLTGAPTLHVEKLVLLGGDSQLTALENQGILGGNDSVITYDTIAFSDPNLGTPEPCTLALMGIGMAGAAFMRRRLKRS